MQARDTFRRIVVLLILASAAAFGGRTSAVNLDERGTLKPPSLTKVTCEVLSNGIVRHVIDGTFPGLRPARDANPHDVPVTVVGTWGASKKEATETIRWTGDIGLRPMPAENDRWGFASMACPSDPWENAVACTRLTTQAFYASIAASEGGRFPVTSAFLTASDRAAIKSACVHPLPSKKPPAAPDPRQLVTNAQLPTPCAPCPGAQYGATHLSNHWFLGAQEVTVDGLRAVLPRRLCPGESVQMMGSLKAPSAPGAYTLKWDLVNEGVAWFSANGVPTHDVAVTVK